MCNTIIVLKILMVLKYINTRGFKSVIFYSTRLFVQMVRFYCTLTHYNR